MTDRDSTYYMVFDKAHWGYLSDGAAKYRFETKEEALSVAEYNERRLAESDYAKNIPTDITIVMVHHVETEIGRQ